MPVQQALRNLDKAFANSFKGRAKYPKCHQKHHAQAATYTKAAFKLEGTTLRLAKMEAPLAIVWSRPLPERCQVSSITISKDCANRYFVSFLQEETIKPLPVRPQMVGIDLGLKSMVVLSTGESVGTPKYFAKEEKKLAKAQRRGIRASKE